MLEVFMRDREIIETELMEISAIADDAVKFERIVAWCAARPDEVPFALHQLLSFGRRDAGSSPPLFLAQGRGRVDSRDP